MTNEAICKKYNLENLPELNAEDFAHVGKEEQAQIVQMMKPTTYWQDAWRRLKQNKIAMTAMIVLIVLILFALIGPYLVKYGYAEQVKGHENLFPCAEHPFGTDNLGRDLMVRAMMGTRISLLIGVGSALIVLLIGATYGAISGLAGGMVDNVMMRIVDVINSLPTVLMVIAIKMVIDDPLDTLINSNPIFRPLMTIGSGVIAIFIVYGLLYWTSMARIIRGQVLQLKEMEYVNAAVALGSNKKRLITKHLLPNCIGQLIVQTMLQIPSAIFTESFLSFLGIGVTIPMASLGSLCSDALNGVISYPYRLLGPAIIISIIILCFNLFGDGLRDALDPRLKK